MGKWSLFLIYPFLCFFSCRKDAFVTGSGAFIRVSADTVSFDTLFVNSGSPTQQLLVYNPNNQKIRLSEIALAGGAASAFTININGTPGPVATDQIIEAGDSLYVFLTANLPATAQQFTFSVQDSLRLAFNGKTQYVQLRAYGRNAHFVRNFHITHDTSWTNDLPYVVTGGIIVDSNAKLTILSGARLYFHAGSGMLVNGSLEVLGDAGADKGVYFTGDRLDAPYNGYPGSWPGLYFSTTSRDNVLAYADIRNADQAVVAEDGSPDVNPKLQITETFIDNALGAGVLGFRSSIYARNCLISNCGQNILLLAGGQYQFLQCTVASYSTPVMTHQSPVLTVSDAGSIGGQVVSGELQAVFSNCIFWGDANLTDELSVDKETNAVFQLQLDHSLLKEQNLPASADTTAVQLNADPVFAQVDGQKRIFDFHLQSASPAIDQGRDIGIAIDLDGNPRPVGKPDIGCYERQ